MEIIIKINKYMLLFRMKKEIIINTRQKLGYQGYFNVLSIRQAPRWTKSFNIRFLFMKTP